MDARRARILSVTVFTLSLLIPMAVAPGATAATCALTAPATVTVGTPLNITGSGFPATTSVEIAWTLEGGAPDEFTVRSDANGAFQINLTPEPQDVGTTTVVATAGTACSAQAVFTVTATSPTASPTPTPTATPTTAPKPSVTPKPTTAPKPTATARPDGSAAGATSGGATPPRTDVDTRAVERPAAVPLASWVLAGLILMMGVGGLIATRRARGGRRANQREDRPSRPR